MNIPSVLKLTVAVFFLLTLPVQVYALTPGQVFDNVKNSIVIVKTLDAKGKMKMQGSGVLISPGRIATGCHVLEGGKSYQVGQSQKFVPATLYAEDRDKEICLLDAKGIKGKPVQFGKTMGLKEGAPVYAVGAPKGPEPSLSDGIVLKLLGGPPPLILTTAAISYGSSGGGLFDGEGRLLGITVFYLEGGQRVNFVIPVEWIGEVKPGLKPVVGGRSQIEWVNRAVALENLKDWPGLLDWCRMWAKDDPKNADPWVGLGTAYTELKRYNDAIGAFRQALRLNPDSAGGWFNLGNDYTELKRYNEAINAYRQALRINPDSADVWNNLGATYGDLKRFDEAINAYRQVLRINPDSVNAWNNLGATYVNLKRYNEAVNAYRQVLRINPDSADAWNNLGATYALSGNRKAALDAVRELRRLDTERAERLFDQIIQR